MVTWSKPQKTYGKMFMLLMMFTIENLDDEVTSLVEAQLLFKARPELDLSKYPKALANVTCVSVTSTQD